MNKSAHYQNARYSAAEVPGLHEAMTAIQRHPALRFISREQVFSVLYVKALARMPAGAARMHAAEKMLKLLDAIAAALAE